MARVGFGVQVWLRDERPESLHRALDEVALAGFDGVELMHVERWHDRPAELARLLALHGLELSSSYVHLDYTDEAELEVARRRADFLAGLDMGTLLLDGGHGEATVEVVAHAANRIGEHARSRGVDCCWHQHWGTHFERPEPFARLMELTDPELVGLCPDTAQLVMGGFDVDETLARYAPRIRFVHFKDVAPNREPERASDTGAYGIDSRWRFVELGRGVVDFPRAWEILRAAGYDGWVVDDLDYAAYAAYDSALACRRYLAETLRI